MNSLALRLSSILVFSKPPYAKRLVLSLRSCWSSNRLNPRDGLNLWRRKVGYVGGSILSLSH